MHGARCTVHGARCTVQGAKCTVHSDKVLLMVISLLVTAWEAEGGKVLPTLAVSRRFRIVSIRLSHGALH